MHLMSSTGNFSLQFKKLIQLLLCAELQLDLVSDISCVPILQI